MEKQDGVQIIQTIALDISESRITQSRGQVQSCKYDVFCGLVSSTECI